MMTPQDRQAVIDDYIASTGAEVVVPGEFIEWLRPQHNHVAHHYFFAKSDADAATEYRAGLFRQFTSGLRISVQASYADPETSRVSVIVREFPAFVSPIGSRRAGGGYTPFDPANPQDMAELRRQGATAMRSWLARYRGAFEECDLSIVEQIAATKDASVALSA